jgi:hypothetical protein
MLTHVENGEREFWRAIAVLVEGYGDRDNFIPRSAKNKFGRAVSFLKPYARGARGQQPRLAQLVLEIETHLEFLNYLTWPDGRDEAYVLDLIANADRQANIEGKYEDAFLVQQTVWSESKSGPQNSEPSQIPLSIPHDWRLKLVAANERRQRFRTWEKAMMWAGQQLRGLREDPQSPLRERVPGSG